MGSASAGEQRSKYQIHLGDTIIFCTKEREVAPPPPPPPHDLRANRVRDLGGELNG